MNSEWLRNEFIGLERRLKVLLAQYSDAQQQLQQLQSENKELQQQLIAEKKEVQSLKDAMNFDALAQLLHQRLIAADKKDTLSADPSSASAVQPLTKANEQAQAATVPPSTQEKSATQHSFTDVASASAGESYVKQLSTHIAQIERCIAHLEK